MEHDGLSGPSIDVTVVMKKDCAQRPAPSLPPRPVPRSGDSCTRATDPSHLVVRQRTREDALIGQHG